MKFLTILTFIFTASSIAQADIRCVDKNIFDDPVDCISKVLTTEAGEDEKKYTESIRSQLKKHFDEVYGESGYAYMSLQQCDFTMKSCLVEFEQYYDGGIIEEFRVIFDDQGYSGGHTYDLYSGTPVIGTPVKVGQHSYPN